MATRVPGSHAPPRTDASGEPVCPRCGTGGRPGARFCDQCGAPLVTLGRLSPSPPPAAFDPGTAGLLAEGLAPDSERKQISVLFGDISDSTRLISGRDPERAWALLNPVLEAMMEAVRAYGGTVNQIQGDGIMALMGAPLAFEDHALRACYAAARMHKEIARAFGPAPRPRSDDDAPSPIQIHIGIATGGALVGTIGSGLTRAYSAAGEVIHIAARLRQMAKPGQTLCTSETLRQAGRLVRGASRGMTAIRGVDAPIEVIEMLDVAGAGRHAPAPADPDGERDPVRLQGREEELSLVRERLERAATGPSQVVALVGEAGVGKSRLVRELAHSCLADGWHVLRAGAVAFGADSPYYPLAGLIRDLFGLAEIDEVPAIRAAVATRLRALGDGLESVFVAALALLDVDPEDTDWAEMEPRRRREAIRTGLVAIFRRLAEERPLLLVLEDLHWVDTDSQALLDSLLDPLAAARVAVLVNYRPEYDPGWPKRENTLVLPLARLSRVEALHLTEALLGDKEPHAALSEVLVERTGGNPFFLQEMVRALAEAGVLRGSLGAYSMAGAWSGRLVPSSVRAVLQARIDRLSPEEKRLLQTVAVIGERFALLLLHRLLSDVTPEEINARLQRLLAAGFVYEASLLPEPRYAFIHALTQEVAYEGLLQERRLQIHAALVSVLEATYSARLAEHAEVLAYHAVRGELWGRVALYARQAGMRAAGQSAYREAVRQFELAIAAFARLPTSTATTAAAIETRFELRNALFPLGEIQRDLESLGAAERLARAAGDVQRLPWIIAYIARDLGLLGHPDEALEASGRALALADAGGDTNLRILARSYAGQAHYALGDFSAAAKIMHDLLRDIGESDLHATYGLPFSGRTAFRCWWAWALARLGPSAELVAVEAALLAEDANSDDPLSATVAQYSAGFGALGRDDCAMAIERLVEALRRCQHWDFTAWFTNIASALGHAHARLGRVEEGLDLLWRAVRRSRALRLMVSHSLEVAWLADATLAAGRVEEARALAAEAVELARRYQERGNEAYALFVSGTVARRGRDQTEDAAEEMFGEALRAALACGMEPLVVRCRRALRRSEAECA